MYKYTFNNKDNAFFKDLKAEVNEYFGDKPKTGDWRLFSKSLILIPFTILVYGLILTDTLPVWALIVCSALMGLAVASIGFNVMHDACHESYSGSKKLNNLMGYSLNLLGGTAFFWKQKHNIIHHTYTNIDGIDDDIAKSPILRHCYTQKWTKAHKFQHLYLPFIYMITSFAWAYIMDFDKYISRKVHNTPIKGMDTKQHVIFWISKALNLLIYIILPVVFLGWGGFFIYFASFHVICGFMLAIVFQLAHVVEATEFDIINEGESIKSDASWAEHQVRTTANFATKNKLVNWYVGGLNFQVEHHLFPRISHVHYPQLSPIVERVCKKHNLPYYNYPTVMSAVRSHWKMMRIFGQNPNPPVNYDNSALRRTLAI